MDNPEYTFQILEVFSKVRSKEIPRELEEYISYVARTGDPVFQWSLVKVLIKEKLQAVLDEFVENGGPVDVPPCPNVDQFDYDAMKEHIMKHLDSFVYPPFTIQRICELLAAPRKEYNRVDKYMRAIEKNVLVVSASDLSMKRSLELDASDSSSVINGILYDKVNDSLTSFTNHVFAAAVAASAQHDAHDQLNVIDASVKMDDETDAVQRIINESWNEEAAAVAAAAGAGDDDFKLNGAGGASFEHELQQFVSGGAAEKSGDAAAFTTTGEHQRKTSEPISSPSSSSASSSSSSSSSDEIAVVETSSSSCSSSFDEQSNAAISLLQPTAAALRNMMADDATTSVTFESVSVVAAVSTKDEDEDVEDEEEDSGGYGETCAAGDAEDTYDGEFKERSPQDNACVAELLPATASDDVAPAVAAAAANIDDESGSSEATAVHVESEPLQLVECQPLEEPSTTTATTTATTVEMMAVTISGDDDDVTSGHQPMEPMSADSMDEQRPSQPSTTSFVGEVPDASEKCSSPSSSSFEGIEQQHEAQAANLEAQLDDDSHKTYSAEASPQNGSGGANDKMTLAGEVPQQQPLADTQAVLEPETTTTDQQMEDTSQSAP